MTTDLPCPIPRLRNLSRAFLGIIVLCLVRVASATPAPSTARAGPDRPNILYILADDLGYGDVAALNPAGKIKTPNLDRLAAQGMVFTDAHSGSAVCTPTRYGILTGRYAWRTRLRSGVLNGFGKPLISAGRPTVASLLRDRGYDTAAVGKWHLGWDWAAADAPNPAFAGKVGAKVDFDKPIRNGPTTLGFDSYFGISASLDMPPYCYVENDRAVGPVAVVKNFYKERAGPAAADFEAADVLPTFTRRAVEYIAARPTGSKPYFLYVALNSPHTPIAPRPDFVGKSGLNAYADFVQATDAAVGQLLDAVDRAGAAASTLVIFTSDNGCSPEADFKDLAAKGHNPSHVFRGTKADVFEGGHRVPFIARWPGKVKAGSTCDDTICLTDLMATAAAITGAPVPPAAGEDSVSFLPDLLGTATGPVREATVHQSIDGALAIRQGKWKLALCRGSGGWSAPREAAAAALPDVQLYDLSADVGERANVAAANPEVVARLTKLLQKYVDDGRSTAGPPQKNDVAVPLAMPGAKAAKPKAE